VEQLVSAVKQINANPSWVLEQRKKYNLLEDLPEELEQEILPYYRLAAEIGLFPEDSGGAEAAGQDFEFYGVAGELKGDPKELKVEDYWYLEPLNQVLGM